MTARELITGSLRLLGVIAAGETMSAEDSADGLSALNMMLDGWSNSGLLIPINTREELTLIALQQTYTIGAGGNFNTVRPMSISNAGVKNGDSETPIEVLNLDQWSAISTKATQSTDPTKVYYEPEYPLGKLHVWPVPTSTNKLVLYSQKPLTTFASINDEISIQPGYLRALRFNLAIELAPEYNREPSALVLKTAIDSKADIMRTNIKPSYMTSDAFGISGGRSYNILTGE